MSLTQSRRHIVVTSFDSETINLCHRQLTNGKLNFTSSSSVSFARCREAQAQSIKQLVSISTANVYTNTNFSRTYMCWTFVEHSMRSRWNIYILKQFTRAEFSASFPLVLARQRASSICFVPLRVVSSLNSWSYSVTSKQELRHVDTAGKQP